jgi:hypothetical protein
MVRVVLKHLNGPRAAQADVLEIDMRNEVVLGQSGAALLRVASPGGDPGGSWQARIIPVEGSGQRFVLVDLNSPAGIYVNKKRVADAVLLRPGDIIQLGEQGAELEFRLEAQAP